MRGNVSKLTQVTLVEGYMRLHGSITTLKAYTDLGITRLSARIWELENVKGLHIYKRNLKVKDRFGASTVVTQYALNPFPEA